MNKVKTERVIWSNIDLDFKDWEDDLREAHPDFDDDELYYEMYRVNDYYLDDERINLSKDLKYPILVFGDLGLWNGRVSGIKKIGSKISDCLSTSECTCCKWYVDEDGDLRFTRHHHDGTNHYLYRVMTQYDDYDEIYDKFVERIYDGKPVDDLIQEYTEPIGPEIAKVYGWQEEYNDVNG